MPEDGDDLPLGERRMTLDEIRVVVQGELPALDEGAAERVAETLRAATAGWPGLVLVALGHGLEPWTGPGDPLLALGRPADPVRAVGSPAAAPPASRGLPRTAPDRRGPRPAPEGAGR